MGGPSGSSELGTGGGSTEMISDGCSDANCTVLLEGVGENLLPTAQPWRPGWLGLPIAAPCTRASHIDLFCYLTPAKASVTELRDLLCGGRESGRTTATHRDTGRAKLIAHRGRRDAQLRTDLAQVPTLAVQVGCTHNVHGATVASHSPDRRRLWFEVKRQADAATPDDAGQGWRSRSGAASRRAPWRR